MSGTPMIVHTRVRMKIFQGFVSCVLEEEVDDVSKNSFNSGFVEIHEVNADNLIEYQIYVW